MWERFRVVVGMGRVEEATQFTRGVGIRYSGPFAMAVLPVSLNSTNVTVK